MYSIALLVALSLTLMADCHKKGIAYPSTNNEVDVKNFNQSGSQISWMYDWSISPNKTINETGVEFIPMQWGAGNIKDLEKNIDAQGAKTLLGFNEPDFSEQSNIDPSTAAKLWKQYIDPLKKKGVRLGGPGITANGLNWLDKFLDECDSCNIDFLCVHWYGEGTGGFYDFLWSIHGAFPQYKVWVTEYADTSTNETAVADFLNATSVYMEDLDWVERFAWFGFFRPVSGASYNLLSEDGGLNALGKEYIGADTVVRSGPSEQQPTPTPTQGLHTISVHPDGPKPTFAVDNSSRKENVGIEAAVLEATVLLGLGVLMSLRPW